LYLKVTNLEQSAADPILNKTRTCFNPYISTNRDELIMLKNYILEVALSSP